MSAEDTLLVVHNPFGLQMQGGRPDKSSIERFVCYWLDHFLRPPGSPRAAVDSVHLKANSYDGRVIVQLSGDIDWDAPAHAQRLQRFLGEHRWREIARTPQPGLSSLVFAFDRALFTGRRLHVNNFGYTTEVLAPTVLHKYDRATDRTAPLVHWETYPAAHWCAVPQRGARIELPIPKPPAPSPPRSPTTPADAPRQPSPEPSGSRVKTEPRDVSLPIPVHVKREPSEDVKPFAKFKMDPDEEEAMSKAARREQEQELADGRGYRGVKSEETVKREESQLHRGVKKEEDSDQDEEQDVKRNVRVKREAVEVKLEPKAEHDDSGDSDEGERKPRVRVKRERSDSGMDEDEDEEDVKPKLEPPDEDLKPKLEEDVKPKLEEEEDEEKDVKPKVEEVEDEHFWIKTESQGEEEDRKPLVKREREDWSRSPSRRLKTSRTHSLSSSRSTSKRVKSESQYDFEHDRDSKPPLRKRMKREPY